MIPTPMADNTRNEETPNGDLCLKTSSNHARDTVRGNIEDIVACLNKAKKAQEIATQDLEKASNWLNKSQELLAKVLAEIAAGDAPKETPSVNPKACPDDVTTNTVIDANTEQTQTKTPTEPQSGPTVHNENVEGAKIFIDKANKALKAGNIDKAESLFLKATRMDASIDVEDYLKDVRDARARNTTSSDNSVPEESPRKPERAEQANSIMNESKMYLQIAENAFKDKKYERALMFLDKSEALYASERVVKLRKQVQDAMSKPKNTKENASPIESPPERTKQTNSIMNEADTYLKIAENVFKDKKYERALIFLDKSEALQQASECAVKLRKQVQDTMAKPTNSLFVNHSSYTGVATSEKPSKPYREENLNDVSAIHEIDAGILEKAQRKLNEFNGTKRTSQERELNMLRELVKKKIFEEEKKRACRLSRLPLLRPIPLLSLQCISEPSMGIQDRQNEVPTSRSEPTV